MQAEKAAKEAKEKLSAQSNGPSTPAAGSGSKPGRSSSPSKKLAAAEGGIIIDDAPEDKPGSNKKPKIQFVSPESPYSKNKKPWDV